MRLTTDFFVAALTRRVFARGLYAAIARRGATEAGAVFLIVGSGRLGERSLYGPAPQTNYDTGAPTDRHFLRLSESGDEAIDARLAREEKFDPDLWIVDLDLGDAPIEEFLTVTTP